MSSVTAENTQQTTIQSIDRPKASLTRPVSFGYDSSEEPIHPPGLDPVQGERLWQPYEDKYWNNLREMWGSHSDLNDFDADTDEASSSSSNSDEDRSQRNSRELNGVHLGGGTGDRTGNTFKIDLAGRKHNRSRAGKEGDTVTVGGLPDRVVTRTSQERQGTNALINSTPLPKALSIHLPPLAHTKSKSKSKHDKNFRGNAINVTVTTTTRTYGDFSKANPPPYTPRPTATERSFGSNGKIYPSEEKGKKWPVAKCLFIFGFFFPLCWLFGSFLLLSGLRKLNEQAQLEENEARNAKFEFNTPMSTRIYSHSHNETVAQRIAQEMVWSKRCVWAVLALLVICIVTFAVLKALGM